MKLVFKYKPSLSAGTLLTQIRLFKKKGTKENIWMLRERK
jgi:hypothetical protein